MVYEHHFMGFMDYFTCFGNGSSFGLACGMLTDDDSSDTVLGISSFNVSLTGGWCFCLAGS